MTSIILIETISDLTFISQAMVVYGSLVGYLVICVTIGTGKDCVPPASIHVPFRPSCRSSHGSCGGQVSRYTLLAQRLHPVHRHGHHYAGPMDGPLQVGERQEQAAGLRHLLPGQWGTVCGRYFCGFEHLIYKICKQIFIKEIKL